MAFDLTNKNVQEVLPAVFREVEDYEEPNGHHLPYVALMRAGVGEDKHGKRQWSMRVGLYNSTGLVRFVHVLMNYDARKQVYRWAITGRAGVILSRTTDQDETPKAIAKACWDSLLTP